MTVTTPSTPPQTAARDDAVRLSLDPDLRRRGTTDGAWWPRSRDAGAELPALIAELDRRLDHRTLRVGLHADTWDDIPRRIPAPGRQVKVGWFRSTDPHLVTVVPEGAEPIMLLVVPPDTSEEPAADALALASRGTAGQSPLDLLTAAHVPAVQRAGAPEGEGAPDDEDGRAEASPAGRALPAVRRERNGTGRSGGSQAGLCGSVS